MKISVLPLLGYVPFGMNSAVELLPFLRFRLSLPETLDRKTTPFTLVATAFSREVEAGRLPDSRSTA